MASRSPARRAVLLGISTTVLGFSGRPHRPGAQPTAAPAGVVLDFEGADPALDIDVRGAPPMPLGVSLLQMIGLAVRDHALESQFASGVAALTDRIGTAISGKPLGYLLRLRLYVDQVGAPFIPGGQLVEAVGPGREPLDALAEEMRSDVIRGPAPPASLRNASSYVWIRERGGRLVASQMPRGLLREKFESDAAAEAERRTLLATPTGTGALGLVQVQRAAFWSEVARERLDQVTAEERRKELTELTERFTRAQVDFNSAYIEYQRLEAELMAQRERLGVLDKIGTLLAIVDGGIKAKQFFSPTSGKDAEGGGAAELSLDADRARVAERETQALNALGQVVPKVNSRGERLRSIEIQIRAIYQRENVVLPQHEPLAPSTVQVPGRR